MFALATLNFDENLLIEGGGGGISVDRINGGPH